MKFEIWKSPKDKQFYFHLKAKNGQRILESEGYVNKAGVKNGIKSVKTNCGKDELYDRKQGKDGKYHFSLMSTNKKIVGSSQMYASKSSMEAGIRAVKRVAPDAEIVELAEG